MYNIHYHHDIHSNDHIHTPIHTHTQGERGGGGREDNLLHMRLFSTIPGHQIQLFADHSAVRGPILLRSSRSIVEDYKWFIEAGGNIKNAKAFNNCMCTPFPPNLDISQVCR